MVRLLNPLSSRFLLGSVLSQIVVVFIVSLSIKQDYTCVITLTIESIDIIKTNHRRFRASRHRPVQSCHHQVEDGQVEKSDFGEERVVGHRRRDGRLINSIPFYIYKAFS